MNGEGMVVWKGEVSYGGEGEDGVCGWGKVMEYVGMRLKKGEKERL